MSTLTVSFGILLAAALLGGMLALRHMRDPPIAPPWLLGASHGLAGATGLIALLFSLRGPPHGVAMGVGGFGRIAAVLLVLALLAGLAILVVRLRHRRIPGLLLGIHATLAVAGSVILAAYALIG